MKFHQPIENKAFIGRKAEWETLEKLERHGAAKILLVYGRRRVGKTELVEQFFRNSPVFKFEGLETDENGRHHFATQVKECLRRLAHYLEDPMLRKLQLDTWSEFFELLDPVASQQELVLYFEEVQWLAGYRPGFLAALKPFWDDKWRHNARFTLILCGSAVSFLLERIVADKALYGRSLCEINLKPFNISETRAYLSRGKRKISYDEALLAHLCVGGIPEYLKNLRDHPSVFIGLCEQNFKPDGALFQEYHRVFVSSLSSSKHYKKIIDLLSKRRYATRSELAKLVGTAAGGYLSGVLEDLQRSGFVAGYSPLTSKDESKFVRYALDDSYLQFYARFVKPWVKQIEQNRFAKDTTKALNRHQFRIALGFALERWCRRNDYLLARAMRFDQVRYQAGAFFNRQAESQSPGFQVDLMFIRDDRRIVICECKYFHGKLPARMASQMDRKVDLFLEVMPKYKQYTIETCLVASLLRDSLTSTKPMYDHIVGLEDLFENSETPLE